MLRDEVQSSIDMPAVVPARSGIAAGALSESAAALQFCSIALRSISEAARPRPRMSMWVAVMDESPWGPARYTSRGVIIFKTPENSGFEKADPGA